MGTQGDCCYVVVAMLLLLERTGCGEESNALVATDGNICRLHLLASRWVRHPCVSFMLGASLGVSASRWVRHALHSLYIVRVKHCITDLWFF